MKVSITKKTHFNPCFWTSLWNDKYFKEFVKFSNAGIDCRKEKVFYLEIKSNKILYSKTEDIFFEKGLGQIEHNSDELNVFVKKYYPNEVYRLNIEENYQEYIWDFENHFTALEKLPPYEVLMKIGRFNKLEDENEKINLALFLITHSMRSHVQINSMIELGKKVGESKFEFFMNFRWMLTNNDFLFKLAYQIGNAKWTIFKSKCWDLPLIDNPVTNENGIILCVLNPYKILKVDVKKQNNKIEYKSIKSPFAFNMIKKRLISNTYKGIAFRTEKQAQKWKNSKYWNRRRNLILNNKEFNKIVELNNQSEIWQLNQLSNKL